LEVLGALQIVSAGTLLYQLIWLTHLLKHPEIASLAIWSSHKVAASFGSQPRSSSAGIGA
jgi:hypothetical protein